MLPPPDLLRRALDSVLADKAAQGHDVAAAERRLHTLPDSYDALARFADVVAALPMRDDWPYVEPDGLDDIWEEAALHALTDDLATVDPAAVASRVEAAFQGSVCGCVLGKPVEVSPTLADLRDAAEPVGEWPISDYLSERAVTRLPRPPHHSWPETVRERIRYAAPDDDINYTILGMLVLERHGSTFDTADLRAAWLHHLPIDMTFGPERTLLVKAGLASLGDGRDDDVLAWARVLNPGEELCGALIRADAYGYACPGRPQLAAELAWRDASWTHRRTGVYGAMFVAAAIAAAFVLDDPREVWETALAFVPRRSRLFEVATESLDLVNDADDWLDGYERIHGRFKAFGHCQIHQEVGTLMNTLRFAEDVGSGICLQVSQGNDTDSFGATAGSILGAYFGSGHLEDRWVARFNDEIRTGLAFFYERSLSSLATRMGRLPALLAGERP